MLLPQSKTTGNKPATSGLWAITPPAYTYILQLHTKQNKSSPKSFGKSTLLRLIADNALVRCMC